MRRFLRRILLWTASQLNRISRGFTSGAVGLTRLAELRAGIAQYWSTFYTDEADITAGLMPWEAEAVSKTIHPSDRVLLIGSGTGRDLLALLERGCRVTGVEPSAAALETARRVLSERGLRAELVQGFVEDVALDGQFDAIVFSYYCYSYIPESRRRVEALRKVARHLVAGGRVLITCVVARTRHQIGGIRVTRAVGRLCRSDWRIEAGDRLFALGSGSDLFHYIHSFEPGEIEREVALAGFRVSVTFTSRDGDVVVLAAAGDPGREGAATPVAGSALGPS